MFRLMAAFALMFSLGTFVSAVLDGGGGLVITTLTADLAANGTAATVSSTEGFLSSGYVEIEGEEIRYTAKGATSLTLTGNHKAHLSGKKVMTSTAGALNSLLGYDIATANTNAGAIKVGWNLTSGIGRAIPKMTLWDYSYLDNDIGRLLKFLFLYPLSIGFIAATLLSLKQVISR